MQSMCSSMVHGNCLATAETGVGVMAASSLDGAGVLKACTKCFTRICTVRMCHLASLTCFS